MLFLSIVTSQEFLLIEKRFEAWNEKFLIACIQLGNYTKDRFNENHLVVAIHENAVIGASAPFKPGDSPNPENEAYLVPRFFYTKLGHEGTIPLLFKTTMKLSQEANWDKKSILIRFSDENPNEIENLDKISYEKTITGIKLGLEL